MEKERRNQTESGIREYLNQFAEIYPLTPHSREDDKYWAGLAKSPDPEIAKNARDKFVSAHMLLVIAEAMKVVTQLGPILALADIIDEGILGLYTAVEKYDPEKAKFSTYATRWVRRNIRNAINANSRPYHLTRTEKENLSKVRKAQNSFLITQEREANEAELSDQTKIKPEDVRFVLDVLKRRNVSLYSGNDDDSGSELVEMISAPVEAEENSETLNFDKKLENYARRMGLAFDQLKNKRQAKILRLRFGINKQGKLMERYYSYAQIGQKEHVTRERIRQIANDGIKNLKDQEIKKALSTFLHSHRTPRAQKQNS